MTHDSREFWNEMWAKHDDVTPDPDDLLVTEVEGLIPGRALELGCGAGGNPIWLAEHGWQVTAIDFSEAAIEKGKRLAAERGVQVGFVVADATTFQPDGRYDLITSFYIQVSPDQRAKMLSMAAAALAPGGTLLFVSHDKSSPPPGWTDEDMLSLTTPEEVAPELSGLEIERALVVEHSGGEHAAHAQDSEADHDPDERIRDERHDSHVTGSTVVRAVRLRGITCDCDSVRKGQ